MFLLSRYRGLSRGSAFLSSLLYTLGGVYAQRLTHGHFEWIAIAWIPFIVLAIHRSAGRLSRKPLCLGGIFLAFLMLDGGPYQFAFLGVFLALYVLPLAIQGKSPRPLAAAAIILILGISLASVKLIPMYDTITKYPRVGGEFGFYGLSEPPRASSMLYQMFLSRNQQHDPGSWMPYKLNVGCYVGWIPLLLAGIGQRYPPPVLDMRIMNRDMFAAASQLDSKISVHDLIVEKILLDHLPFIAHTEDEIIEPVV